MGGIMNRSKAKNQVDQSMIQQQPPGQYGPPGVQMQQPPGQYGPPGVQMQQPPPPQYRPPGQYGPPGAQMQQQIPQRYGSPGGQIPQGYGSPMAQYPGSQPMSSSYENDMYLSSVAGLSPTDVGQLRLEFYNYTNSYGVIDREGFRKLYIASLVNRTWDTLEHEAETAFRSFDVNQTGGLDFNEYIMACARMLRGPSQPSMYQY